MTGQRARAAIEVTAGLIPGQAMDEYTRTWYITEDQWGDATEKDKAAVNSPADFPMATTEQGELLVKTQGPAMAYAQLLMLQPNMLNWVRVDWVWF